MADTRFTDASGSQAGTLVQASWLNDVNTNTYTILSAVAGTNAITGTGASTVLVGYPRGIAFRFIPQNTNTAAMTINISGLGVKNITKYGTVPLVANDVTAGAWAFITYDGVQFQLLNPRSLDALTGILPVANGGTGIAGPALGRLIGTQIAPLGASVYTPTAGTQFIVVKAVGAGGGGAGCVATAAGQLSAGGGGGSGAYFETQINSGFSGAALVVGTGGAGGIGATIGSSGGNTSFGALIAGGGGAGSASSVIVATTVLAGAGSGGSLGTVSGGVPTIISVNGSFGITAWSGSNAAVGGPGAPSFFGGMGNESYNSGAFGGFAPGAGGGGSANGVSNASGRVGGAGANGWMAIFEYA